ncbi:hypothetical protein COCMIDRAFT_95157, partial [Bipolaris oryzae ATCC 44560]
PHNTLAATMQLGSPKQSDTIAAHTNGRATIGPATAPSSRDTSFPYWPRCLGVLHRPATFASTNPIAPPHYFCHFRCCCIATIPCSTTRITYDQSRCTSPDTLPLALHLQGSVRRYVQVQQRAGCCSEQQERNPACYDNGHNLFNNLHIYVSTNTKFVAVHYVHTIDTSLLLSLYLCTRCIECIRLVVGPFHPAIYKQRIVARNANKMETGAASPPPQQPSGPQC